MAKDQVNELNEEETATAEEEANQPSKAMDKMVVGKGSMKSNKGKPLIDKGTNYEITLND